MAVPKGIRSNSSAQPSPNTRKPRVSGTMQPQSQSSKKRRRPNPHHKLEVFATLRDINRGYGIALAALNNLPQPDIFPAACIRDYRHRTESLRALANRDLLRLLAGHEEQDAARLSRHRTRQEKHSLKTGS